MSGIETVLPLIYGAVNTAAPLVADPGNPHAMMQSNPQQQAQTRAMQAQSGAQQVQPQPTPQPPVPMNTQGIDIAQLIAMLSQPRGPYG